jgi:gentisate 1,2-dioxygenase
VSVDQELAAFYDDVARADLQPLWRQQRNLMPDHPQPQTRPWLWRWKTLRALAERAGDLISIERGGDRRVLSLANPGLGGQPFATPTLWGAVQYLGPGESAPGHRHTPGAIRFVLEGEGVYTTVDGDACDMGPGDLVLTPNWTWHDHNNRADAPMIWFDGLDLPLVVHLEAVFFQQYPGEVLQPVQGEHNRSARVFGGRGLLPIGARKHGRRHSPLLVYRREDTDAALDGLLAEQGGPMVGLEYVDPTTGGPALPTMSCQLHRLVPGGRTTPVRRVGSSVVVVYQGTGTSVINGQRFEWGAGDMLVIPSWAAVDHQASEPADLFAITDRPIMEAFGLYREVALDTTQEVTSEFGPDQDLSGPGRWS